MKLPIKTAALAAIFVFLIFSCDTMSRIGQQEPKLIGREKINFGEDWQFRRVEAGTGEVWDTVNIPHTVKIEPLVVNDQWQGTSLYRKSFHVPEKKGQKWFFHFEGVMQEARVVINGSLVHTNKGGYLPFTVDATSFLVENSDNIIEVEVINEDDTTIPPGKVLNDLDFNLYGGIYRSVYLLKTNELYITDAVHAEVVNGGGILVHFEDVNASQASGFVKTHLKNDSDSEKEVSLRISFSDEEGKRTGIVSAAKRIPAGGDLSVVENFQIKNPMLWSVSNPALYDLKVEVISEGNLVDVQEVRTGIRSIQLTGTDFFLNGEPLFINGTNRHQEYPYVGYALSDEAQYRDAYKIKEAGFDFVRLSHYPHATAFLQACDELGLLVMNAIPGWQYYEEGQFVENAIQDIKDMARRDRNHPSVVFWENSLNESRMPEEFMKRANEVLRAELPFDDTYTAGWMDHPSYDLYIPARQHAKPPHYWNDYKKPNRPIFIAEYGDWEYYAQNAGFNQTAFSDLQEEDRTSRQLRGAGEARLLQQALNYQEAFNSNLKGEQTVGHANWLMFDYNRGYANDLEASGISDIFRLPKFAYYFYKSQRPPQGDDFAEPMVFIANYWTPTSTTDVRVFSNTEEVALYLNGDLIQRKTADSNILSDKLEYPPFTFLLGSFREGELKAVGFIEGEEVTVHTVRTPKEPVKIELEVDYSGKALSKNTPDMVFVYAKVLDQHGTVVPTAKNNIQFSFEDEAGTSKIIGGSSVDAEAGIASILLRTETFTQPLAIKATSEGLEEGQVTISSGK